MSSPSGARATVCAAIGLQPLDSILAVAPTEEKTDEMMTRVTGDCARRADAESGALRQRASGSGTGMGSASAWSA
ncbi:MAG: hypothetical protein KKI08_02435 [Armatimonadetes bacterium]|nr:hypothetical protein [Armatimonadota bacterium]